MDLTIMWFIAVIAFIIIESLTYQLVSVWFAFGAIGALIAAVAGAGIYAQLIVFALITALFLLFLRPMSLKFVKNKTFKTNVDSIISENVLITEEVDNDAGKGQGKVNGLVWTVRSEDGSKIPKGEVTEAVRVDGVKLTVRRKKPAGEKTAV